MAESYFVRFRGRTVGPYTLVQTQQMARKGHLSRTSEVSVDGHAWSQAGSFPEIFERPATPTAAVGNSSPQAIAPEPAPVEKAISLPPFDVPKTPSLNEWYYTVGDDQKGPTSTSNIVAMIKAGTLAGHDRVWREGLDHWVSVSDVPEFSAAIGPLLSYPVSTRGSAAEGGAFCRECGARINRKAVICTQCGVPQHPEGNEDGLATGGNAPRAAKQAQGNGLIATGYICAAVSLLFLPPVFSLIAFIIGIINLTRNQIGHGIAQIVLSVICGFFGMVIGAAVFS